MTFAIETSDEAYQQMLVTKNDDSAHPRSAGDDSDSVISLYDPGELMTYWDDDAQDNTMDTTTTTNHRKHQVFLSVEIVQVSSIDTIGQTFDCRFNLTLKWMGSKQDRDCWEDDDCANKKKGSSFAPSWEPGKPELPNVVRVESAETCPIQPEQLGHMFFLKRTYKMDCKFSERLELKQFPFDAQEFPIRMIWETDEAEIRPSVLKDFLVFDLTKMALGEWRFSGPMVSFGSKAVQSVSKETFKKQKVHYPQVVVSLRAHRAFKTTVMNVYIILSLICFTSLGAFTIEMDEGSARLSHASTILLASVAFLYVIESSLPKLSYMTITDYFVFWGVMYVLGVTIVMAVMSYITTHLADFPQFAVGHDSLIAVACLGVWVMYILGFALYIMFVIVPKERRRFAAPGNTCCCTREDIGDFSMTSVQYYSSGSKTAREKRFYWEHNKADHDTTNRHGNHNPVSGILWNSRDYYTDNGDVEYFTSEVVVGSKKKSAPVFVLRTVVGDVHVPAGRLTIRALSVPQIGGAAVNAEMKVHPMRNDTAGDVSWIKGSLRVIAKCKMVWVDDTFTIIYYSTDEAGDAERAKDEKLIEQELSTEDSSD